MRNAGVVYWNRLGAERHARWCERDGLITLPTRLGKERKNQLQITKNLGFIPNIFGYFGVGYLRLKQDYS